MSPAETRTMTTRTTQTIVRFSSAFLLPGFDAPQPAGEYRVDQDEESIDGYPGLPGDASRFSSTCRRLPCRFQRNRWCRSIRQTSMLHSKRTTRSHDFYKLYPTHRPPVSAGASNASLHSRAGRPDQGRFCETGSGCRYLSHHRHSAAKGRFTSIPHPQRWRTPRAGDDSGQSRAGQHSAVRLFTH